MKSNFENHYYLWIKCLKYFEKEKYAHIIRVKNSLDLASCMKKYVEKLHWPKNLNNENELPYSTCNLWLSFCPAYFMNQIYLIVNYVFDQSPEIDTPMPLLSIELFVQIVASYSYSYSYIHNIHIVAETQ